MAEDWITIKAAEVEVGDKLRARDNELLVSRIEPNFLGRDNFFGFIEDTPARWFKQPVPGDMDVQVLRES